MAAVHIVRYLRCRGGSGRLPKAGGQRDSIHSRAPELTADASLMKERPVPKTAKALFEKNL